MLNELDILAIELMAMGVVRMEELGEAAAVESAYAISNMMCAEREKYIEGIVQEKKKAK